MSIIEPALSLSECQCNLTRTVNGSGVCDKVSGQCPCKELLTGRTCNQCKVGIIVYSIYLMTGLVRDSHSFVLLRIAMFPDKDKVFNTALAHYALNIP